MAKRIPNSQAVVRFPAGPPLPLCDGSRHPLVSGGCRFNSGQGLHCARGVQRIARQVSTLWVRVRLPPRAPRDDTSTVDGLLAKQEIRVRLPVVAPRGPMS